MVSSSKLLSVCLLWSASMPRLRRRQSWSAQESLCDLEVFALRSKSAPPCIRIPSPSESGVTVWLGRVGSVPFKAPPPLPGPTSIPVKAPPPLPKAPPPALLRPPRLPIDAFFSVQSVPPIKVPPPVPRNHHARAIRPYTKAFPIVYASGRSFMELSLDFTHKIEDVEVAIQHFMGFRATVVSPESHTRTAHVLTLCAQQGVEAISVWCAENAGHSIL
jgi:hypothetical protein